MENITPDTKTLPTDSLEAGTLARLHHLEQSFLDLSEEEETGRLDTPTLRAMQHGGNLRLWLDEIAEIKGPTAEDLQLDKIRSDYIDTLFIKGRLITPGQRKLIDAESDSLQQEYTDAVVTKIERVIDAHTPAEALEIRQLAPLVRKASFNDGETLTMEQFTANHIY